MPFTFSNTSNHSVDMADVYAVFSSDLLSVSWLLLRPSSMIIRQNKCTDINAFLQWINDIL